MINICKFPQPSFHSPLSTSCFVMETDITIMKSPTVLTAQRMLLVIQGQGTIRFNEQSFPLRAGCLFFGFENESFSAEPTPDTVYMYIDFSGGRARELLDRFLIHKGNRSFEKCDGLIPLWRESLARAQNDTIDLATESILLYTFSRLSSNPTEKSNIIGKILKMSEENFNDPEMSISKIAESLSYNPKYLSHAFKKTMNVTYSEYLRDIRIKYAISLFNEGIDSVKNVALLSGFSDPLYFSNIFKKITGISPREYISSLSKNTTDND